MRQANIAVHIEAEHTCGHMHETIFHVKDPKFKGFVNTQYPEWPTIRGGDFTPYIEAETENKLELTGSLGRIELSTCMCHLSRMARLKHRIVTCLRSLFRQTKEQEHERELAWS